MVRNQLNTNNFPQRTSNCPQWLKKRILNNLEIAANNRINQIHAEKAKIILVLYFINIATM